MQTPGPSPTYIASAAPPSENLLTYLPPALLAPVGRKPAKMPPPCQPQASAAPTPNHFLWTSQLPAHTEAGWMEDRGPVLSPGLWPHPLLPTLSLTGPSLFPTSRLTELLPKTHQNPLPNLTQACLGHGTRLWAYNGSGVCWEPRRKILATKHAEASR